MKKAAAGGFCYAYEYRPDGKLMKKSASGRTLVSCTYYPDGSLKTLTDVSGETVCYSYDSMGKLERICSQDGNEIVRYSHTPGGKLKEIRHGNGMHTVYEYDTDDNVIRLTLENEEGSVISDFRYGYDLNGNRTLKSGSCILPGEECLKEQVIRYRYDNMNRLMEERYGDMSVRYLYDRCGNRLEKVDNSGKEEYNYNRKNQLISRRSSADTIGYQYDLQGNVLEETGLHGKTEYSYNAFNQPTAVIMKDGQVQENQYDAEYLRAEVLENGRRSRFLYYNGELLAESELNETVLSRYILGYGVIASWQKGKEGYYSYHLDEQNSAAYITDSGQSIENAYQYDAYGMIQNKIENIYNRIFHTGQLYDQVTGQYYLRARYYHPDVGRFLQEDVYRGDGLNLYTYCVNNPIIYYDPSGLARKVIPFNNGPFKYANINGIKYNKLLRSYVGVPPKDMVRPHAHHVAYKQGFGSDQQALVSGIQDMLVNDFGIDPIKGKEVLCWAPNIKGQHNTENLIELNNDLLKAKKNGEGYGGAVKALDKQKAAAINAGQKEEIDGDKC